MRASDAIAMLDRQIERHGQPIALRRGSGAAFSTRAFVRAYKPSELVGLITQADRNVVLSPSGLGTFGIPKATDDVSIAGAVGKVIGAPEPVHIGSTLVRVNMTVRMT